MLKAYLRKNTYLQLFYFIPMFLENDYIIKTKKFILAQFFIYKFFNEKAYNFLKHDFFTFKYCENYNFIEKLYNKFLKASDFLFFRKLSYFSRFMFCISVGLGFRKRIRNYYNKKFLIIYMGTRHWLSFFIPKSVYIFPFKRGSLIFFSESKYFLNYFLKHLQHVRRELVFKIKGFYLRRLKVNKKIGRSWSFARRVKFKKIKTKLSKKQKFI